MKFFMWANDEKFANESLDFLKKKIGEGAFVSPASSLPYRKTKMRKAILKFAPKFISLSSNPEKEQGAIEGYYMSLANFRPGNEASLISSARDSNYKDVSWEKYRELMDKKDGEEYLLMKEIEKVYVKHGLLEDWDAIAERFICHPEEFLLFRGERETNRGGLRFTTDRDWATKFGETILQGRLPPHSNIHGLKKKDIQGAPQVGFTTASSWFKQFIEKNEYDAILATDPMSPRTLEIIIHPKHLRNFEIIL